MGKKHYVGDKLDRGGEMSAPDARLSAAERAALADLEAAAVAADPGLAALLRGGARRRLRSDLRLLRIGLAKAAALLIRARWWGVPIALAGMALMVLGLGSAMLLSFAGALVTALGLGILARMAQARSASSAGRRSRAG